MLYGAALMRRLAQIKLCLYNHRVANMVGLQPDNVEPLQVLSYQTLVASPRRY
jgi:hypothetical protein